MLYIYMYVYIILYIYIYIYIYTYEYIYIYIYIQVGARTVGPPAWPKLCKQIEMLPLQDQYGTP